MLPFITFLAHPSRSRIFLRERGTLTPYSVALFLRESSLLRHSLTLAYLLLLNEKKLSETAWVTENLVWEKQRPGCWRGGWTWPKEICSRWAIHPWPWRLYKDLGWRISVSVQIWCNVKPGSRRCLNVHLCYKTRSFTRHRVWGWVLKVIL